MRLTGQIMIAVLLLTVLLPGGFVLAQDGEDGEDSTPVVKTKRPFPLFISVSAGSADADDIDSSIRSTSVSHTTSILSIEGQSYGRAELGWKFQNDRGMAKVIWNGYNEEDFSMRGSGNQTLIDLVASGEVTQPTVVGGARWWTFDINDGVMTSVLNGPIWNAGQDANGDGAAQPDEITYDPMNAVTLTSATPTNLQNRLQTVDLVYGREFGTRRFGSHWFAGIRYYTLEGSIPATAWVLGGDAIAGVGFTDGAAINLLTFFNETTGIGPTASMSWDIKFFDEKFKIFFRGQSTLAFTRVDVESAPFVTFVVDVNNFLEPVDGQLSSRRNKSTWSNELDLGIAFEFDNGIGLELAYGVTGMLDAYLLPTEIRIPVTEIESGQGTSAVYNTQDYVLTTIRAGLSFQF